MLQNFGIRNYIADRVCCFSINLRNLMDGRGAEVLALRCWARKLLDDPLIDECFGVQNFVIRGFRCTVRNTTACTGSHLSAEPHLQQPHVPQVASPILYDM